MSAITDKRRLILLIFIVFACSSQCVNGLKILGLFPLHGKSHFVMCEQLAKGLAAKGHQVDVYSHFPLKKPVPNYTDYSLDGTMPGIVNNMTYEYIKQFERPNMKAMLDQIGNQICDLMDTPVFRQLFEKVKKEQIYDIVIVEVFVSNCYVAWGRYLNVPVVGVMTSGLIDWYNEPLGNPLNTAVTPSIWAPFFYPMSFWERATNTFMYYMVTFQTKYYMASQTQYIEKFFGPNYPDANEIIKDLDLLLVNAHHSISGVRAYTPAIVPVGGLHIQDDSSPLPKEVQKWLDESKSGCMYMSFGSMVRIETFPKEVVQVFYDTFKKIAPVRVLMKIAKPEELPAGIPSNVMTQKWFSQLRVLKHKNMKAFVSHGGLMSILESLSAGIPLIGLPLFGDQNINVRTLVRRQVAVHVDIKNMNTDVFFMAVNEVLSNPIYKKNAEQFAKNFYDRPMRPLDTAIFWVEYMARHGKGALRAPVVDMPWWEANLYDVYGFFVAILLLAYYIIKFIAKKIISICCSSSSGKKSKHE